MESGTKDVNAEIGRETSVFKFDPTNKIKELGAETVMQKEVSLKLDFLGTKKNVYGTIYTLVCSVGDSSVEAIEDGEKIISSEKIIVHPNTRKFDWQKCPERVNVVIPPVKPWETHLEKLVNPAKGTMQLLVTTAVKRKDKNLLSDADIIVSMKADCVFTGIFMPIK